MTIADRFTGALGSAVSRRFIVALESRCRLAELDLQDSLQRELHRVSRVEIFPGSQKSIPAIAGRLDAEFHTFPPTHTYAIPNASMDHRSGLAFLSGHVIAQSGFGFRSAQDSAFITAAGMRYQDSDLTQHTERPIAFLGRVDNFYHFLFESLPRLLAIRAAEPHVMFLATTAIPSYLLTILKDLDIAFAPWEGNDAVFTSPVVWAVTPPELWWPDPFSVATLRQHFLPKTKPEEPNSRVYISRSRSSRSLVGEVKVEQLLAANSFTVVHLEELSFTEQVQLLANAQIVVAPHGAGLSNIAFMDSGTRVLEIASPDYWFPCFARLAHLRGIDHEVLSVASAETSESLVARIHLWLRDGE